MSSISCSTLKKKTSVSESLSNNAHLFPASELEHALLEAVDIYFDTATYDEIERDVKVGLKIDIIFNNIVHVGHNFKVTMEAQLGLIGGTMGLLTGFSILSGVEIIYYLLRFFLTFRLR